MALEKALVVTGGWMLAVSALALAMQPEGRVLHRGIDFWSTAQGGSTYTDFSSDPIPADFFCPGSRPYAGTIGFRGVALATDPSGALRGADTVIERLDDAVFDPQGRAQTRIQVRALSLASAAPIETRCGVFDVVVSLAGEQPITEMRFRREGEGGGTFEAPLEMVVQLEFLPRGQDTWEPRALLKRLSFGAGSNSVWSSVAVKGGLAESPAMLRLDTDGDRRPDTTVPGPSNFRAGWSPAATTPRSTSCCVESCHCAVGSTDPNQPCGGCQHYHCVWARVSCDFVPSEGACVSEVTTCPGGLVVSEVVYDASGADDGLEWVEIFNRSEVNFELSGYSLGHGGSDYTVSRVPLSGVVSAGGTFLVGGPTSSGSNGSPRFDQVVDFDPDLENSGATADGVALFDVQAAEITAELWPIDAVVYGGANTSGLIDETGWVNPPEVGDAPAGASIERATEAGAWQIRATPSPNLSPLAELMLSEVLYDVVGPDGGLEWVELYYQGTSAVDLSGFSLGNGGLTYTSSLVQLSGTVGPGQTFVVGGPISSAANADPLFDQVVDFSPDFQNSGTSGDGVALFAVPAAQVTIATVPIDAVVYGPNNDNGLIDETGEAPLPAVGDAPPGSSIERTPGGLEWQIQPSPTPNSTPF